MEFRRVLFRSPWSDALSWLFAPNEPPFPSPSLGKGVDFRLRTSDFGLRTLDLPLPPARLPPAGALANLPATIARKNIAPHIWTLVFSFWLRRRAAGNPGGNMLRAGDGHAVRGGYPYEINLCGDQRERSEEHTSELQ